MRGWMFCERFLWKVNKFRLNKEFITKVPVSLLEIPEIDKEIKNIVNDGNVEIRKGFRPKGAYKDEVRYFSEFKAGIAMFAYDYWCKRGGLVVDPFMGRATRGVVAGLMGLKYIGFDVCKKTVDWAIKNGFKVVNSFLGEEKIKAKTADGCLLEGLEDGSVDMVFSCPPYWNKEKYESVESQLSDCKSYEEFLRKVVICASSCLRVLKDGCFAVFLVKRWREKDKWYLMDEDFRRIFKEVGFIFHDEVYIKVYSFISGTLLRKQNVKGRHLGGVVENLLVFRKGKGVEDYNTKFETKGYEIRGQVLLV